MSSLAILCVDDEKVILDSLTEQLKRYLRRNFEIEAAESGEEALEILEEFQENGVETALVVSDQIMPGLKGDELLVRIHARYPKIVKIMLTGQADAQAVGNAVNAASLYRYIAKPWDETDLILTVKEALRSYSQSKQLAVQNETLRQLNLSLEQKVRERTQALEQEIVERKRAELALLQAKEMAETANCAKSEFLANMSHELRTPLNAILGFTQIMNRDPTLSLEQKENLDIITRGGEHLLDLINDVLEMSKIEAGRTILNETSFDLLGLLDALEVMLRIKAESKGLGLHFEIASEVPRWVATDPAKLRQVLINLLGNAIKFTAEGQVILRVQNSKFGVQSTPSQKQATEFRVQATGHEEQSNQSLSPSPHLPISSVPQSPDSPHPTPHTLKFEVEDTGEGVAPEEIEHLFEPFVQTESGRKSQQGTGLGLPISQKFVKLMGGDIRVESDRGRGSLFQFEIRARRVEAVEVPPPRPIRRAIAIAPNQPSYRILVADDKWENRQLLVKLLLPLGFKVKEAANGQEAIALWESWQPQLIWMDMRMPIMDGYRATQHIKSRPNGRQTAIVALTASAWEEEREAVLASGCDDFVRKPFREAILFEKMSKHLGVHFLYEEVSPAPVCQPTPADPPSMESAVSLPLDVMPLQWRSQLREAAKAGNDEAIYQLIAKIPPQHSSWAATLTDLTNNFNFRKIRELTQEAE